MDINSEHAVNNRVVKIYRTVDRYNMINIILIHMPSQFVGRIPSFTCLIL